MSKNTQYDRQSIIFQVEDNYGVPETVNPAAVLFVDEFDMDPYTGNEETLDVFCKNGGARSKKSIMTNQHSSISFGMPLTFPSAPGALASWSGVMRACNMDAVLLSNSVKYTVSATGSSDSGTLRRLMEYDETVDHEYLSAGCRGQIDLVLEHQKRPRFNVSNMLGSYVTPDLAAYVDIDCESMASNLAENLTGALVNEISLAGVNLCAKSITVKNLGGVTTSRDGFLCPGGDQTMLEETQCSIEIEFENTDWIKDGSGNRVEFNVFEIAESHGDISTHPFIVDCGEAGTGLKFEVTNVQATKPKVLKTTGGRKGAKLELLCISLPELTIY